MKKQDLEKLKAQYGRLYCASIIDDSTGEEIEVYLKPFDRQTYLMVQKIMQSDQLKAVEIALDNLAVGTDKEVLDEIKSDVVNLNAFSSVIVDMLGQKSSSLKKI